MSDRGAKMHALAERLFPINRSLTGKGVRETLRVLQEYIPLQIREVPSGTQTFDWVVPKEWNITDAYIVTPNGEKIADFKKNNLHVVGYSVPIDTEVSLKELQEHLYSIAEQPDAIPYITSYYTERWGFCMSHREREKLIEGTYRVRIESELKEGALTYGELIVPGSEKTEVLLSTYVCHPSLANDNLSGPVVAMFLAKWLLEKQRRYTYRIVFIPETIGSIVYLSQHHNTMRERTLAGFVLTCMGDERGYSYMPTPRGDTFADRIAQRALSAYAPDYKRYSFLQRGSDERQYCSPGIDLPVVSVMRSKYYEYPEYHTSLDDLSLVTANGLSGGYEIVKRCIELIEASRVYRAVHPGEPQLGKRGLYPDASHRRESPDIVNVLAYADGTRDLIDIAEITALSIETVQDLAGKLEAAQLLERV